MYGDKAWLGLTRQEMKRLVGRNRRPDLGTGIGPSIERILSVADSSTLFMMAAVSFLQSRGRSQAMGNIVLLKDMEISLTRVLGLESHHGEVEPGR